MSDVSERKLWPKYMRAYEKAIRETSRPEAPWYVLPADNKWFTRLVAAAALAEALDRLKLEYPKLTRRGAQGAGEGRQGAEGGEGG